MAAILDHKNDESADDKKDIYITTKYGHRRIKKRDLRWKLLAQWNNGTDKWIPLKDLKESNPVELAEF